MTRIEDSLEIRADPERLSQYLMDVGNLPNYLPISDIQVVETTDDGTKFRHKMTAAGRTIETACETKIVVKNKKLAFKTLEGMKVEGTWLLEPTDKGTNLSIVVDYEPPGWIFGWIIDALMMKKELKKSLQRGSSKTEPDPRSLEGCLVPLVGWLEKGQKAKSPDTQPE